MSARFNDVEGIMQEVLSIVDESNDPFAIGMAYGVIGSRLIMAGQDNEEARALVAKGLAALKGGSVLHRGSGNGGFHRLLRPLKACCTRSR